MNYIIVGLVKASMFQRNVYLQYRKRNGGIDLSSDDSNWVVWGVVRKHRFCRKNTYYGIEQKPIFEGRSSGI